MKFALTKSHFYGVIEVTRIPNDMPVHKLVEKFQANLKKSGIPDGITYQVYEGDWISAMIAGSKLP